MPTCARPRLSERRGVRSARCCACVLALDSLAPHFARASACYRSVRRSRQLHVRLVPQTAQGHAGVQGGPHAAMRAQTSNQTAARTEQQPDREPQTPSAHHSKLRMEDTRSSRRAAHHDDPDQSRSRRAGHRLDPHAQRLGVAALRRELDVAGAALRDSNTAHNAVKSRNQGDGDAPPSRRTAPAHEGAAARRPARHGSRHAPCQSRRWWGRS